MREAVGGTFIFNIMIIFIFFFASFLAIAINYSQAFRIKNQIINIIEQYEGVNDKSKEKVVDYIKGSGYYRVDNCNCYDINCTGTPDGNGVPINYNGYQTKGLCVRRVENSNPNPDVYYKVTTFVSFDLPIIGSFITIPVKGETKVIINDTP